MIQNGVLDSIGRKKNRGMMVTCRECSSEFYQKDSNIKDCNFCSKECSKKFDGKHGLPILVGPRSYYNSPKSEVLICEKCGNKYLYMDKYDGECYLCIKNIKSLTHNQITYTS